MRVDIEVTLGLELQVEQPVFGEEFEHMVEEADAGGNVGPSAAIDVEDKFDVGFAGFAFDGGGAAHDSDGLASASGLPGGFLLRLFE